MPDSENNNVKNTEVINYKVVFLGEQNVGKSSIILRYFGHEITSDYLPTIGIDFCSKIVEKNNKTIRLFIWDTAGQERFRSLISTYLRDCDIAIVVYDITSTLSFANLRLWFDYIKRECNDRIHTVLVGNKSDLADERKVSKKNGEEYAKSFGHCFFIEASAVDNTNVNELFDIVAENASKLKSRSPNIGKIQLNQGANKSSSTRSCSSLC